MATRYFLSFLIILTVMGIGRVGIHLWAVNRPSGITQVINSALEPKNARAIEAAKAPNKPIKSVSTPEGIVTAGAAAFPEKKTGTISKVERDVLLHLKKLKEKRQSHASELEALETRAKDAEKQAREQIAILETLEERIKASLAQEKTINDKKIKRLAAVYEGMKANKSAPIIARMELSTVVRMMARMDEKKVGKILSNLQPDLAVKITEALTQKLSLLSP